MSDEETYLNTDQAAQLLTDMGLPTAPGTLTKLRCVGGGPTFSKWGRLPVYRPPNLREWAAEKLGRPRRSSSDQGKAA
jgi:hypothetical protein